MSTQPGIFTLSLDCEGLWGMADNRAMMSAGTITGAALHEAYAFIRETLDREGIVATAAFVSAFAAPVPALRSHLADFEALAARSPAWFAHLMPRLREGGDALDGLAGHALWRMLKDDGHEMAWHGTTHLPLAAALPPETVEAELELGRKLWAALGEAPRSVVFPRNIVGHTDALRRAGLTAYRDCCQAGVPGRVVALAREWQVFDRGDRRKAALVDGWCVLPPGFFLNWPSGVRGLVPAGVTSRRWRSMLRAAAADGRQLHMWFHPHNLITAPAMRPVFARIMRETGEMIRRGELLNLTMSQIEARCRGQ